MKKILFLLFVLCFQFTFAQNKQHPPTFHRMLIFNADSQLMVVKIKGTDFWVTPGLYQNNHQSIREGIDSIASTYGMTVSRPQLKGIFTLHRELSLSLRNVFVMQYKNGEIILPANIEEVRWLNLEETMATISFPHINEMILQIWRHPDVIWGGALTQEKEGDIFLSKKLEAFYPLSE